MKKKYLFITGASQWNKLIRKFQNLHKRMRLMSEIENLSQQEYNKLSNKLNKIFSRLEKLQQGVGIKLAGTALAFMLISATAGAQEFTSKGNLTEFIPYSTVVDIYGASFDGEAKPALEDLNGDGNIELYLGTKEGIIETYTYDGMYWSITGRLQADGTDIDIGENAAPTFADLDGDGDLDLYVGGKVGNINIFTNDGSGTFTSAGNVQAGGSDIFGTYLVPTFADIDGDGDLDLYVGNGAGNIETYTNDGSGTFTSAGTFKFGPNTLWELDVYGKATPLFADYDSDGDLDLLVGDKYGKINVYSKIASGTFQSESDLQADGTTIDVGGNSAPAFNNGSLYVGSQAGTITKYYTTGPGIFSAGADFTAGGPVDIDVLQKSFPEFADIDGDGDLDLYVGDVYGKINVFLNDGNNVFSSDGKLQADGAELDAGSSASLAFADLDGDNDLDLYVGDIASNRVKVYLNDGSGTFTSTNDLQADGTDIITTNYFANPVFADLDADGDLDLYLGTSGGIDVFENDGSGAFTTVADFIVDGNPVPQGVPEFADLDNDGDLDLYVGNGSFLRFYEDDGTGTFGSASTFQVDGANLNLDGVAPIFVDLDGDGDLDLYAGSSDGTIKVFENIGIPVVSEGINLQADGADISLNSYASPVFADIDNDGDLDLYVADESSDKINVYTNDGSGVFTSVGFLQANGSDITTMYDIRPTFADIDGDGDLDLYVSGYEYGYDYYSYMYYYFNFIRIYTNDGTGAFSLTGNLQADGADIYNGDATFADIDKDGDLDLYVDNGYGKISIYTNDGLGAFSSAGILQADGIDIDVSNQANPIFEDLDADGDLDLFVGDYYGKIAIYINDGSGAFSYDGVMQSSGSDLDVGSYSNPVFADVNNNGLSDLFVGNRSGYVVHYANLVGAGIGIQPINQTACENSTAVFTIASSNSIDFQWQVSTDGGIVFSNLTDDATYSGSATNTLNVIANTTTADYAFQCIVTNPNGEVISDVVALALSTIETPTLADVTAECSVTVTAPTTESCAGTLIGTTSDPLTYNTEGTHSITWNFDDGNGNNINVIQSIVINDVTDPTITCLGNQTVEITSGTDYTVVGTEFDPTATDDNCAVASVVNNVNSGASLTGELLPVGTTTVQWTVTDESGNLTNCSMDIEVTTTVGISELNEATVSIYPNPTTGVFNIEANGKFDITVFDITGRKVQAITTNIDKLTIDISDQQNGIYFVEFRNDNIVKTIKIVKK